MKIDESRVNQFEENARQLLRRLIHGCGLDLQDIDDQLGFARGYTCRLLGGSTRLTFRHILLILELTRYEPKDFFNTLYAKRRRVPGRADFASLQDAGVPQVIAAGAAALQEAHGVRLPQGTVFDAEELGRHVLAAIQQVLAGLRAAESETEAPAGS